MQKVMEYLFGRLKDKRPVTHKVDGVSYAVKADGTLGDAVLELAPQWTKPALHLTTLSGLADAFKAKIDDFPERVAVLVVDCYTVQLVSLVADAYGRRHVWVESKHKYVNTFLFGNYYSPEDFLIAFRTNFLFNEDAVKVQQLCSTIGAGEAVIVANDGISQEVTVKSGTVTRAAITLPAEGVPLIPWRTFRDAAPVESKFLLRMKGVKDGLPKVALFEIDAYWQLDTVGSIATWLEEALPGTTIIA